MRTLFTFSLTLLLLGCGDDSDRMDSSVADASMLDSSRLDGALDSTTDSNTDSATDSGGLDSARDSSGLDSGGDGGAAGVISSLTLSCDGELQGRAIVNFNTNLGVAFTDPELPFSSRASISFDFPSGFTGTIANPEIVDGGPRHTLAITDRSFTTYGNHCWPVPTDPQPGSATIEEWRPADGVVRASFREVPLRNCVTMGDTCLLNGSIETTGEGVFD